MLKITIETLNDAFIEPGSPCPEIDRILKDVSRRIFGGETHGNIKDSNGSTIGEFSLNFYEGLGNE